MISRIKTWPYHARNHSPKSLARHRRNFRPAGSFKPRSTTCEHTPASVFRGSKLAARSEIRPPQGACQVPSLVVQRHRSSFDKLSEAEIVICLTNRARPFSPFPGVALSWNTLIQPLSIVSIHAPAARVNSAANSTRNSPTAAPSTRWLPAAVRPLLPPI